MTTVEQDMEIANIIIHQLGGYGSLKAMINAKNYIAVKSGVSFNFTGCKKLNYIKITLNEWDTYNIVFGKFTHTREKIPELGITISHPICKIIEEINHIYNDQLIDVFERHTGLYLTFYPRK